MTRLLVNGPVPPEGIQYCAVCVSAWKTALITSHGIGTPAALADWVKTHLSGPDDGAPAVLAAKPGAVMPPLAEAVTTMPVTKLGGRTAAVCWTHADAVDIAAAPAGPPGPPPGLIAGMS